MYTLINDLKNHEEKTIHLRGWASNRRDSKGLYFIVLRDGTGWCQCVVNSESVSAEVFENCKNISLETSLEISGIVRKDEKQIGGFELQATDVKIISIAQEYPISKKEHGVDFLMDKRHLWLRTQRQWAIMKIRNQLIFSIHNFFQAEGFVQMDAPLFTGNACEGTSNLFETDYYGDVAYLSQSGQLYGEAMAMAMGKIYTFGPTFRAEKSKTRRHLSEFWMIEPEMAFFDIFQNMDLIEKFLRNVVNGVLENCKSELEMIGRDTSVLKNISQTFPRLTYDEAVSIIKGEKDVAGKNSIKTLEDDLKKVESRIVEINNEITDREEKIKTPGMNRWLRHEEKEINVAGSRGFEYFQR